MDESEPLRLSNYRDRVVLLHFWESAENVFGRVNLADGKAFYDEFKHDRRFAMIGLNVHVWPINAHSDVREHEIEWPQGFLGDRKLSAVVKAYGVTDHSAWFLIGPNGRIIESGDKIDLDRSLTNRRLAGGGAYAPASGRR
jgi:hypothetical protein